MIILGTTSEDLTNYIDYLENWPKKISNFGQKSAKIAKIEKNSGGRPL